VPLVDTLLDSLLFLFAKISKSWQQLHIKDVKARAEGTPA
jgi:hypothetical protein